MSAKPQRHTEDDASLFIRPLRQLRDDGKPVGEVTMVALIGSDFPIPFGTFSRTKNHLIFWPIIAKDAKLYDEAGRPLVIDHLSLNIAAKRTHATGITRNGKHRTRSQSWPSVPR